MFLKKIQAIYELRAVKTREEKEQEENEVPEGAKGKVLEYSARVAGTEAASKVSPGMPPEQRRSVLNQAFRKFLSDNKVKGNPPHLQQMFLKAVQEAEDPDQPDLLN